MANRITARIAGLKPELVKFAAEDPAGYAKMDAAMVFDFEEYTTLQTLKSLASEERILSTDEAMTVYGMLGEGGPDRVNGQDLATRRTLLVLLKELLGMRIAARLAA